MRESKRYRLRCRAAVPAETTTGTYKATSNTNLSFRQRLVQSFRRGNKEKSDGKVTTRSLPAERSDTLTRGSVLDWNPLYQPADQVAAETLTSPVSVLTDVTADSLSLESPEPDERLYALLRDEMAKDAAWDRLDGVDGEKGAAGSARSASARRRRAVKTKTAVVEPPLQYSVNLTVESAGVSDENAPPGNGYVRSCGAFSPLTPRRAPRDDSSDRFSFDSTTPLSLPRTPGSAVHSPGSAAPSPLTEELHSLVMTRLSAGDTVAVAALQLGGAFVSATYALRDAPEKTQLLLLPDDAEPGNHLTKIPCAVLLSADGTRQEFGFAARRAAVSRDARSSEATPDAYFPAAIAPLIQARSWSEKSKLTAEDGETRAAGPIVTLVVKELRERLLDQLRDHSGVDVRTGDVDWAVIVPDQWDRDSTAALRHCCAKAGLPEVILAAESSAAAAHIRSLTLADVQSAEPVRMPLAIIQDEKYLEKLENSLRPDVVLDGELRTTGVRYMILHCGATSCRLMVLEVSKGGVRMIGCQEDACGAEAVDREFAKLLDSVFGAAIMSLFRTARPGGWNDLCRTWAHRRCAASPWRLEPLGVALPFSFIEFYRSETGDTVEKAMSSVRGLDVSWSRRGVLNLHPAAVTRLFQPSITRLKQVINVALDTHSSINWLFLLGGFCSSPLVVHDLRHTFASSRLRVFAPRQPSTVTLRGAVALLLNPAPLEIIPRAAASFGVGVLNPWRSDKHPVSKRVKKSGQEWCTDVFDRLVTAGDPLATVVTRQYQPTLAEQKQVVISLYRAHGDVMFLTDPGVTRVETLRIPLQGSGDMRKRRILLSITSTPNGKLTAVATDQTSGKQVECRLA